MGSLRYVLLLLWCLTNLSCGNQPANSLGNAPPSANVSRETTTPKSSTSETNVAINPTPRPDEIRENPDLPFDGTTEITEEKNETAGPVTLKAIRTGEHKNFDRIVLEFEGATLPWYRIEYLENAARQCGSGNIVSLESAGRLEIRLDSAQAHDEKGQPIVAVRELAPNYKTVKELKQTCDFEGEVTWVAGVASPNEYRVLALKNPARLVIDVKH